MDLEDATAWITDDAAEMAALLREAEPDRPVPACPGWSVSDLSRHVAMGFAAWYCYNISTPAADWTPEGLMARFAVLGDDHLANVDTFEAGTAEFVRCCRSLDLAAPTWSFGGTAPAGWWVRRAGTELTVHLTDAAGVLGRRSSTTPERHAEAIDEVTTEVFPRLEALMTTMGALTGSDPSVPEPPERSVALVADDVDRSWTFTRSDDGTARVTRGLEGSPAAVGRGSSADVLAWLHGRPVTAPLSVDGDEAVLDDWNLFQRSDV